MTTAKIVTYFKVDLNNPDTLPEDGKLYLVWFHPNYPRVCNVDYCPVCKQLSWYSPDGERMLREISDGDIWFECPECPYQWQARQGILA